MIFLRSFKNSITSKLTKKQTNFLRNLIEPPFLFSPSSKDSVLILGCQRSGTTLTYLIFNSHPQVKGIDETDTGYAFPHQSVLYRNSLRNYLTCLKLPNQTSNFKYITQHFPKTKILIPIRNPYQVVASMRAFKITRQIEKGNWLDFYAKDELLKLSTFFPEIKSLKVNQLNTIEIGAYIWKYKNLAITKYRQAGLKVFTFKYENLLSNPRPVISKILNFTDLEWDDIVLKHQQYYDDDNKRYPGGTRGNRPIGVASKQKKIDLSSSEIESITSICKEQMAVCGYEYIAT